MNGDVQTLEDLADIAVIEKHNKMHGNEIMKEKGKFYPSHFIRM